MLGAYGFKHDRDIVNWYGEDNHLSIYIETQEQNHTKMYSFEQVKGVTQSREMGNIYVMTLKEHTRLVTVLRISRLR